MTVSNTMMLKGLCCTKVFIPHSVYSLLRESCVLKGRNNLLGALMSHAFLYARGARQESVEGPDMWNQVLDNALREPAACWESGGIGFRLATDYRKAPKRRRGSSGEAVNNEGRVLHHLCWADDLYARAVTLNHLTRILEDKTNAIEGLVRWKEKPHHCCWPIHRIQTWAVEIVSSGRAWRHWHVVGQSWLLGVQHVAQNLQGQLHVLREEGLVLWSRTASQEAY